jgi:predicted RNase H-like HicB family nuclease
MNRRKSKPLQKWCEIQDKKGAQMKLKTIIHTAEEGGYWAEVPSIPGCITQGETFEELIKNLYEAIEGCLSVDIEAVELKENDKIFEIAI